MNYRILFLVLFGLLFTNFAMAENGDLFQYDKEKVNQEMTELNALEHILLQNQELSYEDLMVADNPLVLNLDYSMGLMTPDMINGPIIPAFWWGCIFGPVGVLIVYIVEDDRDQTKSAFWGCVIAGLVWGGGYGLWGIFGVK